MKGHTVCNSVGHSPVQLDTVGYSEDQCSLQWRTVGVKWKSVGFTMANSGVQWNSVGHYSSWIWCSLLFMQ